VLSFEKGLARSDDFPWLAVALAKEANRRKEKYPAIYLAPGRVGVSPAGSGILPEPATGEDVSREMRATAGKMPTLPANRFLTNPLGKVNRVLTGRCPFSLMKAVPLIVLSRVTIALATLIFFSFLFALAPANLRGQDIPSLVEVVPVAKLLPLLPEAPAGWTADKPEGSTTDAGGVKITNVHREYQKGSAADAPSTTINILDSFASPEYITSATAAWNVGAETAEGYSKSVTIDGQPGFETFENEGKHGTLWLVVGKRFFLEIETRGQDAKDLLDWLKRIDIKKLAEVK
jgi:hypothetical protein